MKNKDIKDIVKDIKKKLKHNEEKRIEKLNEMMNYNEEELYKLEITTLKMLRWKMYKEKRDTTIIDRVIKNVKQRESEMKMERKYTFWNAIFSGTLINGNRKEEEMDLYDLDESQKQLIRDGKYNPYSFEEDEIEEDDYYFEDDNEK